MVPPPHHHHILAMRQWWKVDINWFKKDLKIDSDNKTNTVDDTGGILVVHLLKEFWGDLVKPWKNTLIVKFFRKKFSSLCFSRG